MKYSQKLLTLGLLIFSLIIHGGCKKEKLITNVKFLGHKGAGGNFFNDVNMENTIPSIDEAIQTLDGVEVDVAMSLDGTIWMYHNQDVNDYACDDKPERYIPAMRDTELEKVMLCYEGRTDRLYKFSELIDFWETKGRSFFISIDVKPTFPAWVFELAGGRSNYYDKFAESLSKLPASAEATDKIFLEFDSPRLLSQLKLYENTKKMIRFYTGDGDSDEHIKVATARGYDGISVEGDKSSADAVKRAKAAGLKVQLWTPYFKDELQAIVDMDPDFIHTDNIHAKQVLNIVDK